MSFLIKTLSSQERQLVASFDSRTHVLAVEREGDKGPHLTAVARKEMTFWQLFLRCFGCGTLASKGIYLRDLTSYLNKYQWAPQSEKEFQDPVYRRVCHLANRAFLRGDRALFQNVSTVSIPKEFELMQTRFGEIYNQIPSRQTLLWNPLIQVQQIVRQFTARFPYADVLISSDSGRLSRKCTLSKQMLREARIIVQQRIYEPVPVHIHLPP